VERGRVEAREVSGELSAWNRYAWEYRILECSENSPGSPCSNGRNRSWTSPEGTGNADTTYWMVLAQSEPVRRCSVCFMRCLTHCEAIKLLYGCYVTIWMSAANAFRYRGTWLPVAASPKSCCQQMPAYDVATGKIASRRHIIGK
jgi:hypothetical protein